MKHIFISLFFACIGLLMGMWDTPNVLLHAVGVCGVFPLAVGMFFLPMIMGSDTRDGWAVKKADREEFRRNIAGEYTSQEYAAYLAQEDANYAANMAGFAKRTEGYDASGKFILWKDVVTDQHGNQHIVREGSYKPGFSVWDTESVKPEPAETLFGEVMDDVRYNTKQLGKGRR